MFQAAEKSADGPLCSVQNSDNMLYKNRLIFTLQKKHAACPCSAVLIFMSNLFSTFSLPGSFRWQDIADILIVSFIVYRIIILIRGTRAVQMLVGGLVVALLYFLSTAFDLLALQLLLRSVLSSILLILVIIFQDDIRRALTEMGRAPFFRNQNIGDDDLTQLISAAVSLSRRRIGALIIIERETGLQEYIETGFIIDSRLVQELLLAIFQTKSPLHDGAVVIKKGRIHSAACVLPLSKNLNIDKRYGMRHRAALGLSEMTDAVILSVSEETQEISVVQGGTITPMRDEEKLESVLRDIFLTVEKKAPLWRRWINRKRPQ